ADDQTARPFDRRAGTATLIVYRSHNRVDAPRRYLFHRAGRNVVRLEVLTLVGLKLVEPSHAGFHLLGGDGFCSHGPFLPLRACGCGAGAGRGHATAAPPSSVMNSRRLIIRSPRRRGRATSKTDAF